MRKILLLLFFFVGFVFIIASCSKSESENITSENNTIVSAKKPPTILPLVEDPEKKYAAILCGDSTHVGTVCNVIGNSCKFHECNAWGIERALSEMEILELAKKYADEEVKNGFIERKDAKITIDIMTKGLRDHNKRLDN